MENKKKISRYENCYPISKTLRFQLKPYGKTEEYFEEENYLTQDKELKDNRKKVMQLFDAMFEENIEKTLSHLTLATEDLVSACSDDEKIKKSSLKRLNECVIEAFPFAKETGTKLFEQLRMTLSAEENDIVSKFDKFHSYFSEYFIIRKFMFTGKEKGSISYRLFQENLGIYHNNINRIKKLPKELQQQINDQLAQWDFSIKKLDELADVANFSSFLAQSEIDTYNTVMGGIAYKTGEKQQGINELINQYAQQNNVKLAQLAPLYKMILSNKSTPSFVIETIENDEELKGVLMSLLNSSAILPKALPKKIMGQPENIYINATSIGSIPSVPYHVVRNKLIYDYDSMQENKKKNEKYIRDREKAIAAGDYSLERLNHLLSDGDVNLKDLFLKEYERLEKNYNEGKDKLKEILKKKSHNYKQSEDKKYIKAYLDSIKAIQGFIQIFDDQVDGFCPDFSNWLGDMKEIFLDRSIHVVYDKVRNYLTKKPYSEEKIKLNFASPMLASGWDENKETDYSTLIFRKMNQERKAYDYFLGVWNKKFATQEKVISKGQGGAFEKMVYKLFPDPKKMLPKLFLSKKWKADHPVSTAFLTNYKNGHHKPGDQFDVSFLHELIDYFKNGLQMHEYNYQEMFDFKLKETKEYQSYQEFIDDVKAYDYKVKFVDVTGIDELVDAGKLYLFQIWSKDFSTCSKGTKNLHTIYFESLFSEENLQKKVFKLSGEAELFYRPKSIHYSEEKMKKGHHYEELKDKFDYPIIKDKRYAKDQFMFHVPIQINHHSQNLSEKEFNTMVQDQVGDFTHMIGIDRGERHLLYYSVINIETGQIVEQNHLDGIVNARKNDGETYRHKLEEKSINRDRQRKSWEDIESIKELKEGYISQVVHEICELQKKYQALIVLEYLNVGFKNFRKKVEKQVYQKFESALIKKMNYVIDKKDEQTFLHGRQLTTLISSIKDMKTQSGIVFFVPAWNTSNIDPSTGFANLIYANHLAYKSVEKTKEFIGLIDKISFDDAIENGDQGGAFTFSFDFSKWNSNYKKSRKTWVINSYGNRIETVKDKETHQYCSKELDLTEEFKKILHDDGRLKKEDPATCKEFLRLVKLMLQLRNSKSGTEVDYIISPVMNQKGEQYDSRTYDDAHERERILPNNADANGAYNIARKGLMVVDNIKNNQKSPFYISNEDYLIFLQNTKNQS